MAQFVASATEFKLGGPVTLRLNVANMKDMTAAPMRLTYDASVLKLVEIRKGDFLSQDGQEVIFSEVRSKRGGESVIQLQRVAGSTGVNGSGTLLTLRFDAIAQGTGVVALSEFSPRDSRLQPISATPPRFSVVVR
jgi:hypothetical protein